MENSTNRRRKLSIGNYGDDSEEKYKNKKNNSTNSFIIQKQELDHTFQVIKQLYLDEKFCDVTFKIGDNFYYSHKIILAASNSFLSGLVISNLKESREEIININCDPILFKYILNYIYGIRCHISTSQLLPLLSVANEYSMFGLCETLSDILIDQLTNENCCTLYSTGELYQFSNLCARSIEKIYNNFASVSKTNGFMELSEEIMKSIISSDNIIDCDEAVIFDAVACWIDHNKNQRQKSIIPLLKLVRFPLMDSCLLIDVIKIHPLMKHAKSLLMEAFEHHSLKAASRIETNSLTLRIKPRKHSCSLTNSTLLYDHTDAVSCLLPLDDMLISGSWDSSIKIWAIDNNDIWMCIRTLSDHIGSIRGLTIFNDKLISCSDDGNIKVWNIGTWTLTRSIDGHEGATNCLIQCRDRLVSAGDDGTIKLWKQDWVCDITIHQSPIHTENNDAITASIRIGVMALEVCHDKLISGGDDSYIRIWNTYNWNCEIILKGHTDEIYSIKFTNEGKIITGSIDCTLKIWKRIILQSENNENNSCESTNTNSNSQNKFNSQNNNYSKIDYDWICENTIISDTPIYSLACLQGSLLVSAGAGNKISLWKNINDYWQLHKYFDTEESGIWSLCCFRNTLISGGVNGHIRVWE